MNRLPQSSREPPVLASLDAAGLVAADVICVHCGYNLRTLHPEGMCPECGGKVAESLHVRDARVQDWLVGVKHALAVQIACITLGGFVEAILMAAAAYWHSMALLAGVSCGLPLLVFVCAIALVKMTQKAPSPIVTRDGRAARLAARVGMSLLIGAAASMVIVWMIPRGPGPWRTVATVAALASGIMFGIGTCGVLPISGFCYLVVLMRHLYRPDLERGCRRMVWMIAASDLLLVGLLLLDEIVKSPLSRSWHAFREYAPVVLIVPYLIAVVILFRARTVLCRASISA